MFWLIPLIAVMFAETLSRSLGYGISELGVTINGHRAGSTTVLAPSAGTDYALLLVSRYRQELHRTTDKVAIGLALWLRWLWPRLGLWLTRFFCVAALVDLVMEGFVHPFHPETLLAKLTCQLTLFGVYALYLAVLRPIDVWRTQNAGPCRFDNSRAAADVREAVTGEFPFPTPFMISGENDQR